MPFRSRGAIVLGSKTSSEMPSWSRIRAASSAHAPCGPPPLAVAVVSSPAYICLAEGNQILLRRLRFP